MNKGLILTCPECQSEIPDASRYVDQIECPKCNKKWVICKNCGLLYKKISGEKYCEACQDAGGLHRVKITKYFVFLLYLYANFLMVKNDIQKIVICVVNLIGLALFLLIDRKALAERKSTVQLIYGKIFRKEEKKEIAELLEESQQFKVKVSDIGISGFMGQTLEGKIICPRCGTTHLIILGKSENPPSRTCSECKTRLIIEYPVKKEYSAKNEP